MKKVLCCGILIASFVAINVIAIITIAVVTAGGIHRWDDESAPDIKGASAMKGVSAFAASNGWNMCTNDDANVWWDDDSNAVYIKELPWIKYRNRQFPALTKDGILFVLSDPGWHHDYAGVAYNPNTNRFPEFCDGFKPIGQHWYVWCELEFPNTNLAKIYE